jgi:hypothetical protein
MNEYFSRALSDEDLQVLARHCEIPLAGIYMRNALPRPRAGCYIWNMDDAGSSGTHWTAGICTPHMCVYFDPFGAPPPLEILAFVNSVSSKCIFNNWIIQDPAASTCGLYCLAFLRFMTMNIAATATLTRRIKMERKAEAFAQWFVDDTRTNERRLRDLDWRTGNLFHN